MKFITLQNKTNEINCKANDLKIYNEIQQWK
jgi:hypothetical protein